jgi:hypothetical protein
MLYNPQQKTVICRKLFYNSTAIVIPAPSHVSKSSQINIRFDDTTDAELVATAAALGVSKSALVRRLTEAFLAEVKRTGAVQLKPSWVKELGKADARSGWGERRISQDESIAKVAEDEAEYKTKKGPKK